MPHPTFLLVHRVPRADVILGRAYVIHARNGSVGVALMEDATHLGYQLRREKFRNVFLDTETDGEDDDTYGTAIPLWLLPDAPPTDPGVLLAWLAEQETAHEAEIEAWWIEVRRG